MAEIKEELKFAQNKLIDSIKVFNLYLRHSVRKVYKAINDEHKDAKVFWFDFEEGKALELPILNGEVCLIDDDTGISYYWIEYEYNKEGKPQKKFAFFCKDIDTNSGNIHVIPGVFERFKHSNDKENTAFVTIDKDNLIKLENVPSSLGCVPFSEPYSEEDEKKENNEKKEWWVPIGEDDVSRKDDIIKSQIYNKQAIHIDVDDKNTIRKDDAKKFQSDADSKPTILKNKQMIPIFAEVSAVFAKNEKDIRKQLCDYCDNVNWAARGGNASSSKYTIVAWKYFGSNKDERHQYCANFFKIQYFKGYGFLTRYNYVNLEKHKDNKRIPRKNIIKTVYKIFPENSNSDSTETHILSEIKADKFKEKIDKLLTEQSGNKSNNSNNPSGGKK